MNKTDYWVSFPQWEWDQIVARGRARQANHKPSDRDSERVRDDPNYEHVCGYIGEEAFSTISGLKHIGVLSRRGDGGIDFRAGPFRIDTKGRSRDYYAMLIKAKYLIPLSTHIYCHCWVNLPNRTVRFWGWVYGNEVSQYPVRKSRNSKLPFMCYEIEPRESAKRDMKDLVELCKREGKSVVLS